MESATVLFNNRINGYVGDLLVILKLHEDKLDKIKNDLTEEQRLDFWFRICYQITDTSHVRLVEKMFKFLFLESKYLDELHQVRGLDKNFIPSHKNIQDFIILSNKESILSLFDVLVKYKKFIPCFSRLSTQTLYQLKHEDKFKFLSKFPYPIDPLHCYIFESEAEDGDEFIDELIESNPEKFRELIPFEQAIDLDEKFIRSDSLFKAYPDHGRDIIKKNIEENLEAFYNKEITRLDNLEKEFSVLKAHLETMPDGKLYLETRREFYRRQGKDVPDILS